jgi:hypothetical protein
MRLKEEKRKAKLKENLGVSNVQSRFLEDALAPKKEVIIEEIPTKVEKKAKRVSSLAPLKPSSNFNRTAKDEDNPVSQSS